MTAWGRAAANMNRGYVIGAAIAFFARYPAFPPEWRLLVITGFCGGLTTFSTFSAEVVSSFQSGQATWAISEVVIHVAASLLMTFAGMATVTFLGG